jgi:ABC-type multidrug transport system ATPase subunit
MDAGRVIASGTADELKAQVGGDRLELEAAPGADSSALAAAVAGLGTGNPAHDPDTGRVVLPVHNGPRLLSEVAAALAETGMGVAGVAIRRPSLDEVFLTLTGQRLPADGIDPVEIGGES